MPNRSWSNQKNKVVFLAVLFCLSMVCYAQSAQSNDQSKIVVKIELVESEITVIDDGGKLVTDLERENFRGIMCPDEPMPDIRKTRKAPELGPECKILESEKGFFIKENVPPPALTALIDTSGSTAKFLDKFSKPSVITLLETVLKKSEATTNGEVKKPDDKYRVWEFGEGQREIVAWTQDIEKAKRAITRLEPSGNSAIIDSLYVAIQTDKRGIEKHTKIDVVVTDGIDTIRFPIVEEQGGDMCPENKRIVGRFNGCRQVKIGDVINSAQARGHIIYIVDWSKRYSSSEIASSFNKRLNSKDELELIAISSGGAYYGVKNDDEAKKAFRDIENRIGKRYVISSYVKAKPGWYRIYYEIGKMEKGVFKINKKYTENASYPKRVYIKR